MIDDLLLHPKTAAALQNFLVSPGHAAIIDGSSSIGKYEVAKQLVKHLLNINTRNIEDAGTVYIISPQSGTISIAEIRALRDFLKLKTLGDSTFKRSVIIDHADTMTIEAQNAVLKILEEPPSDTVLLLTTVDTSALLPTVRSRSQRITIQAPTKQQAIDYFASLGKRATDIERAYHISQGRVGLMVALINGEQGELLGDIELSKKLLAMNHYDRLTFVNQLIKDKEKFSHLIDALEIVCRAGLGQSSDKDNTKQVKHWHSALGAVVRAKQELMKQANLKLLATDLALHL